MRWVPRAVIALLLLTALSASLAGAGLVRTLAHPADDIFCCCGDPADCHCTANCCNHGPAATRSTDPLTGPVLNSSISCRFPGLPDGGLARAAGSDAGPFTVDRRATDPAPRGPTARLIDAAAAPRRETAGDPASPRAPPGALPHAD
ncbi:MAG TPA: hypothetical protein PKJ99_04225 [Thermoanaerobaculales bacterium]|nr:hypothetical protein [Thermoanaerobaculales bacterium]HPA79775.1 hypothetical protein [Thermoanaerobaculales bacterium]HQN94734.1 hypothetical protein [Thermoanaerobaculales bacterium]HQP42385.1 hypothetical protein [Thermoanaerobaculales bacterium]